MAENFTVAELYTPETLLDLDLKPWIFVKSLSILPEEDMFGHGTERKLRKYLATAESFIGQTLVEINQVQRTRAHVETPLGIIVGVTEPEGWPYFERYWIVKRDEKLDIFPGCSRFRPVRLEST